MSIICNMSNTQEITQYFNYDQMNGKLYVIVYKVCGQFLLDTPLKTLEF